MSRMPSKARLRFSIRPAWAMATWTSMTPTANCSSIWPRRARSIRRGAFRSLRRPSANSAARCWSAISATAYQRVRPHHRRVPRHAAGRDRQEHPDRRSVGPAIRQRRQRRRRELALLRGWSAAQRHGLFGIILSNPVITSNVVNAGTAGAEIAPNTFVSVIGGISDRLRGRGKRPISRSEPAHRPRRRQCYGQRLSPLSSIL